MAGRAAAGARPRPSQSPGRSRRPGAGHRCGNTRAPPPGPPHRVTAVSPLCPSRALLRPHLAFLSSHGPCTAARRPPHGDRKRSALPTGTGMPLLGSQAA